MKELFIHGTSWMQENWILLSLIASEVAALLPFKVKGIVDAIIQLGNVFFKKRVSKQ